MSVTSRFASFWRNLLHGERVERDLDDEVRAAFEILVDEKVRAGLAVEEARRAAALELGGIESVKERVRDVRTGASVDSLLQDLRFAVRQLLKHRGFACTAVLVLSLGIAASVAIFGFVDAALIKPLPYRDPSRLVTVFGMRADVAEGQKRGAVSYLDFLDWRTRIEAFESIAAYDVRAGFNLTTAGGVERVPGLRVTSGFFRTLGVSPLIGREFNRDEEGPAAPPSVVISYGAWQTRFGGRPDVLGEIVTLQFPWLPGGEPHVVIGVLPPGFHFAMAGHAEFWVPIRGPQACWEARRCQSLEAIARLADGVSVEVASANTTSVLAQLRREYPDHHPSAATARLVPLREVMLGDVRPVLLMLLGGAGLLLLIACINVVSLLLARSDHRSREIAVRSALGASTSRLWSQFATEALLLAALGVACGLTMAAAGLWFLNSLLSAEMISRMPYLQGIGLSARLVAFACVVSLVAAVAFAVTPLLRIPAAEKLAALKEGGRHAAGISWRRFGSHLVVAELAVAVVLLVSAGLLSKSLYRLTHVEMGFNTRGLATLSITPVAVAPDGGGGESGSATQGTPGALARRVADRVAALPGVIAVGHADLLPLAPGLAPSSRFWIPGRPEHAQRQEDWPVRRVSAGYFETLQSTLLRGRYFTEEEVDSSRPVMIVNDTAARRYFPDESPIGRAIAFGGPDSPAREIVGVVADIKDGPPETPAHPAAYVPFDQMGFSLVVRTSLPEQRLLPPLVSAIHEIDPDLLVNGASTMTERMKRLPSTSMKRSTAWLIGGFAATALFLSIIGLYGVVAYSVGQRTREIGVRMALGAGRRSVYRMVLGEATWLVVAGAVLGIVCAVIAATLMRHLLFDVQSWDPITLATAAAVLIVAALVASFIPARRAASVNPIEVLRAE